MKSKQNTTGVKNESRSLLTYPILAGVLILPLVFLQVTIDPVTLPRMALLGTMILFASTAILVKSFGSSGSPVWIPLRCGMVLSMIAYLLIGLISLSFAVNIQEGLFAVIKAILALFSFIMVVVWLAQDVRHHLVLIKGFSLTGFILATIGLGQYFLAWFTEIPGDGIPYGTMANPNLLASAVFISMFLTIYGCFRLRRTWRSFALLALGAEFLCLVFCRTRSVYLGLGLALLTILIAAGYFVKVQDGQGRGPLARHRRALRALATLTFLTLTLLSSVIVYDLNQASASDRLLAKLDYRTFEIRLELWEKSFEMYLDHPVFGVGAGNWKVVIPNYGLTSRSTNVVNAYFQRPHNDFIWVLTETGPIGLIFYITIFGFGILYCLRSIRFEKHDSLFSILMLGCLAGYLGVALFSYPMERITHTFFLMTVLAMIVAAHQTQFLQESAPVSSSRIRVGASLVILVTICALVLFGHRLRSEIHVKRAVAAATVGAWDEVVIHLDRARSPYVNLDPTGTPLACYRGIANSSLGLSEVAHTDYLEAHQANPFNLQVLNNLATTYEQMGNHTKALEHYQTALRISPYHDQTLVNLAAVYYNMGEYETAYQYLTSKRSGPTDPRYEHFLKVISERLAR